MVIPILILILLTICQAPNPTLDELFPKTPPPPIASVRTISTSDAGIKPCQGVTLVFEVVLRADALRTQWPRIARDVSRLVRLNGRDRWNRLSENSTNSICAFEVLWPVPPGREPPLKSSDQALIGAACQIDAEARTCLFTEPGDYRLEFFFGNQILETTVHVVAPTPEEGAVIEKLNTVPMLLLLSDPTDAQYATPENLKLCEELLATPSDYSKMLSLTVGVAKGRRVSQRPWSELTEEQRRSELEERSRLLESVRNEDRLTSRLSALAAFELANVSAQLVVLDPDPDKRAEYVRVRDKLMSKVAECDLSPREQGIAKQHLQALGREP